MSKHLLIFLISAAGLASGCQNKTQTENPQPLEARTFARQWATVLSGQDNPVTHLYVADQFVFAYRQDGTSSVMDRQTGRLLHIDQPKGSEVRMHPPVVLKNRIIYPTTDSLEAYDFQGRYIPHPIRRSDLNDQIFSEQLPFSIRSDAIGQGKYLYFGADFSAGGRAVAVDMTRPYVPAVWTLMVADTAVSAAPALSKDAVFVAADNGTVAAVSIDNREPLWSLHNNVFQTGGGVVANLADDQTSLYVPSTDTKLYCLAKVNGKLRWQYYSGAALRSSPVVTKDVVYQWVPGTGLAAIDKNAPATSGVNREPRWIAANAERYLAEDAGYVYALSGDHRILALDKKTGQEKFASRRNDLVASATNTGGDAMIFVATSDGRVMGVRPVLQAGSVGEVVMAPVSQDRSALALAQ